MGRCLLHICTLTIYELTRTMKSVICSDLNWPLSGIRDSIWMCEVAALRGITGTRNVIKTPSPVSISAPWASDQLYTWLVADSLRWYHTQIISKYFISFLLLKKTFFSSLGFIINKLVMDSLNFDNLIICLIEYLFHHNPNCARDTAQVMVVTGLAHTNSS